MRDQLLMFIFIFHSVGFATCGYPPMGDEVQPGSVLLPASRRGRYLANIVRRQAVDGTGIKFNKDADRMNAEAKKKVDVLSEELLPYIIAEQERRTTLYKRVMTAIQNGEKGATIVEIRNKPPAIVRKGLMYRCPTNRAPREPDGSGVITCEGGIDPTPIMFDSCLSAEDKELYVADNKYFFCNRHKIEGPDLPRNGTTVIGCPPCERTPLNYTSQKCALEDTDDVVVHYRYYPDRTYKFVSELDPDREVCEHWNPCQVGYIFSLPGPDQATPASELWHTDEEIEKIVPQENNNETVFLAESYTTSPRKVRMPNGYYYHGVGKYQPNGLRSRVSTREGSGADNIRVIAEHVGNYVKITLVFTPMRDEDATTYYARFADNKPSKRTEPNFVHIPLVTLTMGQTQLTPLVEDVVPAQQLGAKSVQFKCRGCALRGVMLRAADGTVRNVPGDRYRLQKFPDEKGEEQSGIEIDFEMISPSDLGDYFLMLQNDDGSEERIKALTLKAIKFTSLRLAVNPGEKLDQSLQYTCDDCDLVDVLCNGASTLAQGHVALIPTSKSVNIKFEGFDDTNACVYMGIFKKGESIVRKILAVIENNSVAIPNVKRLSAPVEGAPFEDTVKYNCAETCNLEKVTVNGIPLETVTRRTSVGSVAYFLPGDNKVTIGVTEFSSAYEGSFQGEFIVGGERVTKSILEIGQEATENWDKTTTVAPPKEILSANVLPEGMTAGDDVTASDAENAAGTDAENAAGTDAENAAGTDAENAAGTDAENAAGTDAENAAGTDAENAAGTDAENTAGTDAENTAGTHAEIAASTNAENAADTDAENTAGTNAENTAGTNAENTAGTNAENAAGTDAENAAGTDAENAAGTDAENTAGTDAENTAGTHAEIAASTNAENAADTDAENTAGTNAENTAGTNAENTAGTNAENTAGTNADNTAGTNAENTAGTNADNTAGTENTADRRTGGKIEKLVKSKACSVHVVRASVPAGLAYKPEPVRYSCPGGTLLAVSCRGQAVSKGLSISTNNTVNINFEHFEDANACVYMGLFKIGQVQHNKTLAVLENSLVNVTASAVVAPPPGGQLTHRVEYSCNAAKCDPEKIYINNKTLKSDDKKPVFTYKHETVKEKEKEIMKVTIDFTIKPFSKEFEGVYQLVLANGTERVTKNIMEVGSVV